ncbi:MAG: L,D-transpeptidase family protein [Lachnospiraceae bacterium]|nr:L,D-transpeptidase family protein [Lachnospiraceae bacterium]
MYAGLALAAFLLACGICQRTVPAVEPPIVLIPSDPATPVVQTPIVPAVPVVPILPAQTVIPTIPVEQTVPALPAVTPEIEAPVVPSAESGMTYVDVNIANQILTYFVNGSPVLITPCVTGSPGRSTPKGIFQINNCTPGKYLTGPTWHVWVDRWMRFSGNCGIHDATWRKQFGGDIYLRNGSHGCVNIPHDQAILLYNMVGIGTVVYVH